MPHASAEHDLGFARSLLDRLLVAAPEVIVSWPGRENDRELMPSPLIPGIEEGSRDTAGSPGLEKPADRWLGSQPLTAVEDVSGPPVAEGTHLHGGTRLLADQAACPFRAYARHRLFAGSPGDPEPDPSPLTRGSLLHATLDAFWRAVGDQQTLLACNRATLDRYILEAVDAGLAEDGRDLTDASRDLERSRLRRRLAGWLDVERQRAPFAVVATEDRRDVTVDGLTISTQIDRLDRLDDGRHVMIDYKSGNAQRDGWFGDRLFEPQLPLYAVCATEEAIAAVTFATLKPGDLRFVGTAEDNAVIPRVKALASDPKRGELDSWQELLAQWRIRLGQLAAEVRQGLAVVAPQKNNACDYCELGDLCRIAKAEDEQPMEKGPGADG
jgi:probable DNA repair protein